MMEGIRAMKTTQMKAAAGSETGNFARRLLEAAQQHNPEEYPFIQGVLAGTISRAALRSYAA